MTTAAAAQIFPVHRRGRMLFKVFGFRRPNGEINDPGAPAGHGDFNDTEMHDRRSGFWGRPADWPY
jgi:hypothetical protein